MPGSTTLQYDVFDRLTRGPLVGEYYPWYGYDAFGRRVWRSSEGGIQHVYFYDPGGRLLADLVVGGQATIYQYFAGQRIHQYTDRVGTVRYDRYVGARHYYPYGEEITSTNSDTYKFAQLHRDGDTGLDYAVNRYYGSGIGRFLNTDPNGAGTCQGNPQTQNRFAYVHDDPVNYFDPQGTNEADPSGYNSGPAGPCGPGWMTDASLAGPCSGGGGSNGPGGLEAGGSFVFPRIFSATRACHLRLLGMVGNKCEYNGPCENDPPGSPGHPPVGAGFFVFSMTEIVKACGPQPAGFCPRTLRTTAKVTCVLLPTGGTFCFGFSPTIIVPGSCGT